MNMNDAIDPLLNTHPRPTDRRQMLQELKARNDANFEQPSPRLTPASKPVKKKAPRPARAAKIFVFGLSTTAMFGAVSGYALADLHQKQHSVPTPPVTPANVAVSIATSQTPSSVAREVTTQTPASSNPPQKTPRSANDVAVAPAADSSSVAQTPTQVAPTGTTAVIDVPVPQSAQAGQGQTSGGNQQSSGSY